MLLTPWHDGRSEWSRMADYTTQKVYRGFYNLTVLDWFVDLKDSQNLRNVEKQRGVGKKLSGADAPPKSK